jgi:hypothetical protein
MATKFLRKIILEELQKVLEEQGIPGAAPGQTYTPVAGGVTGKSMRSPKPGDVDFMGPEQPTAIPGSGSVISSSPRRMAVLKVQKELNKLGFLDKKDVDGVPGPKTAEAFSAAMGAEGKSVITGDDMKKFSVADLNTMAPAIRTGNRQELQRLAVKYRADKAAAPGIAAFDASNKKSSATAAGTEDRSGPGFSPSGLPQDVMTPEERKKALEVQPLKK